MNFINKWVRKHQAWTLTRRYEINMQVVYMTCTGTIKREGKIANMQHVNVQEWLVRAGLYYKRKHFLSRLSYRQGQTCRKASLLRQAGGRAVCYTTREDVTIVRTPRSKHWYAVVPSGRHSTYWRLLLYRDVNVNMSKEIYGGITQLQSNCYALP
jgi:hypothetical protein